MKLPTYLQQVMQKSLIWLSGFQILLFEILYNLAFFSTPFYPWKYGMAWCE